MRSATPSSRKIRVRWDLTVFSLISSRRAISLFGRPSTSRSSTSRSRADSPASGSGSERALRTVRAARELLADRQAFGPQLSAREEEVLALLAEGLPNKLIARRLEISERTVKGHLTRIFERIGVTDRTQAALWARERTNI